MVPQTFKIEPFKHPIAMDPNYAGVYVRYSHHDSVHTPQSVSWVVLASGFVAWCPPVVCYAALM
jgi:hypothetical protein